MNGRPLLRVLFRRLAAPGLLLLGIAATAHAQPTSITFTPEPPGPGDSWTEVVSSGTALTSRVDDHAPAEVRMGGTSVPRPPLSDPTVSRQSALSETKTTRVVALFPDGRIRRATVTYGDVLVDGLPHPVSGRTCTLVVTDPATEATCDGVPPLDEAALAFVRADNRGLDRVLRLVRFLGARTLSPGESFDPGPGAWESLLNAGPGVRVVREGTVQPLVRLDSIELVEHDGESEPVGWFAIEVTVDGDLGPVTPGEESFTGRVRSAWSGAIEFDTDARPIVVESSPPP